MAEKTGLGTKFLREDDLVTGDFDEIAQVANIAPPQLSRDVIEVDSLNPPNQLKQKLLGLIDGGELNLTLNFDPADPTQQDLESDLSAGVEHNYRIEYPFDETVYTSGSGIAITGIVTGFAPQEISAGDVMQAEVTITVTAKPEPFDPVEII